MLVGEKVSAPVRTRGRYKKPRSKLYALPIILQTVVLHLGHLPLIMFILFLVTTFLPPLIFTCFLHFMHRPSYSVAIVESPFPVFRGTAASFMCSSYMKFVREMGYFPLFWYMEGGIGTRALHFASSVGRLRRYTVTPDAIPTRRTVTYGTCMK